MFRRRAPKYDWEIKKDVEDENFKKSFLKLHSKELNLDNRYISDEEKTDLKDKYNSYSNVLDEIIDTSNKNFIFRNKTKILKEFEKILDLRSNYIKNEEKFKFKLEYTIGAFDFYNELNFDDLINQFNSKIISNEKPLVEHRFKKALRTYDGYIKGIDKLKLRSKFNTDYYDFYDKLDFDKIIDENNDKLSEKQKFEILNDFKEFWDSIKHKTTYAVEFDTDELVSKCIQAMQENLNVKAPKLIYTKSGLTIEASGVNPNDDGTVSTVYSNEDEIALPDIVTYLQNETDLTRRTIVRILIESETIDQFKKNPQEYMQETSKLINKVMPHLIIDGIKYTKIDDYYSQELFKNEELFGYLERNMIESENSVYDHIIYDSEVEKNFALRLDKDPEVKLYTKLPTWFKIKTPLGNYNPDWAVMIDKYGENKLYFVVETKGTTEYLGIKASEQAKIDCGRKHFKALGDNIHFDVADTYKNFKTKIVN